MQAQGSWPPNSSRSTSLSGCSPWCSRFARLPSLLPQTGRFTVPEAATCGLAASAKNLDKVLLALLIAAIPAAAGIYLRTLIPHEYARLSAFIWVPIIAFVSLAFAHGYRQVASQSTAISG